MMSGTSETIFYNALNILTETDYRKLRRLYEKSGSWQRAWEDLTLTEKNKVDPEAEWNKIEKIGLELILKDDEKYPPLLKEIPFPPHGLYLLGQLPAEPEAPTVAIVGTRKATEEGKAAAHSFAYELTRAGCSILSGLAFGIDAAAHLGAVKAEGQALAVLATGLEQFSPASNKKIAEKILRLGGAILSEHPLGTPVRPQHFLERNRIISGLSLGTLLIEAPERSGSLATARFAMEQNRAVFVLPGPAGHPNFAGSNELIRSGAELVTKPDHILESLNLKTAGRTPAPHEPENEEEGKILSVIRNAGRAVGIDKIIEDTNLETRVVTQTLTMLMIKNVIEENSEGYALV